MSGSGELSFTGILHVKLTQRGKKNKIFLLLLYYIYNKKDPTEFISEGRIIYYLY